MDPPTGCYNATVDLLERNLQAGRSAKPYLLTPSRALCYAEVVAASDGVGAGLLGLGLELGDRVLILLQDCAEFVCTFWGAMKVGLIPVPVCPVLSAADLRFILADSQARAMIFGRSVDRLLPGVDLAGVELISVHATMVGGVRRWADVVTSERVPPASTQPDDTAFWLYTSGTTGKAKAVLFTHGNLRAVPAGLARQVVALDADDTVLSGSRMFFAYGLGNSVYLPAAAGAAAVVDSFPVTPSGIQGLIERHSPTVLFAIPSFYRGYVELPEARLTRSVRQAFSAGDALSVDAFHRFRNRFGLPLLDGFGSTEMMHHVTSNRSDEARPGSAGRPLDGFEIEIRGQNGRAVAEGTSGELWVRGPTMGSGYWNRPKLSNKTFVDSWLRTGDRGHIREGYLYHEGRLDDLMKLGGIWVSPREIEALIGTHQDVAEAAVVQIQGDGGVPILKAFVCSLRTDSGLQSELAKMCRAELAPFKVPRCFETVPDLPRTPTGKLRRFELR